jgi:hypothetical protein
MNYVTGKIMEMQYICSYLVVHNIMTIALDFPDSLFLSIKKKVKFRVILN